MNSSEVCNNKAEFRAYFCTCDHSHASLMPVNTNVKVSTAVFTMFALFAPTKPVMADGFSSIKWRSTGERPIHADRSGLISETAKLALAAVICDVITHTKISQYRFRINRDVTCDSISGGSLLCLGYRCSGRVGAPSTLLSSTSPLTPRLGVAGYRLYRTGEAVAVVLRYC